MILTGTKPIKPAEYPRKFLQTQITKKIIAKYMTEMNFRNDPPYNQNVGGIGKGKKF